MDRRNSADNGSTAFTRACVVHPFIRSHRSAGPVARSGGRNGERHGRHAVQPHGRARDAESRLDEAVSLTRAIDLDVVHAEVAPLARPRPATLFGLGKVEAIAAIVDDKGIDVVVVDGALSPVQQRNLERRWGCKVIDRTALILEIFGARARTREGTLQVELAALSYQRSRLVRSWTHLERQRGGYGFLGGPGETQIEADRRQIRERIMRLKRDLADVARTRALHRKARRRVPYPVVALVGYTNAGKSTLFNRLTGAHVAAKDQLFATLDPTMRVVKLPSGRHVILSDTVGFVSDLPHDLVAAFRATLEEVVEADVIVHVRDISHPETAEQREDVHGVLRDIGLEERVEEGMIEVLNKLDRLDEAARRALVSAMARTADAIPASALTGAGLDELLAAIDARLARERRIVDLKIDLSDGATIAWLYRHGEVLRRNDDDAHAHLRVGLAAADAERLMRRPGVNFEDEAASPAA